MLAEVGSGGKPRIAIFGAGTAGIRVGRYLRKNYEICCFVDNDPVKRRRRLLGAPIVSPDVVSSMDLDMIFIASCYSTEQIEQLVLAGVDPNIIDVPPADIRLGELEMPLIAPLLAGGVALVLGLWML